MVNRFSLVLRFFSLFLILLISACSRFEIDASNDFANNGLDPEGLKRDTLYLKESLPPGIPYPAPEFKQGLEQQITYLNKLADQQYTLGKLSLSTDDLKTTVKELENWLTDPTYWPDLAAYQLAGQDHRGNVQITGYYVPVLSVRRTPDDVYKYPLYRKPPIDLLDENGEYPTREDIDFDGALNGKGLEIAYSASLVDNFFLHVQGSGVIEFEDGTQELLSWGGVNGHPYHSLGKELISRGEIDPEHISAQSIRQWLKDHPDQMREVLSSNPSYLFFHEGEADPIGAANVPLTPLYSAAVDPSVIPLGAVLLVEVPILDEQGHLMGHQFQLLLAQDKGGAIKGAGHIDWYQGIGEYAHKQAGQLKHFGKVWLLLPRHQMPIQQQHDIEQQQDIEEPQDE